MEIGTEISRKIRAAIKGKLQELGAYVDEELPDYIMVMVANKKSAQQMADDLSLFLGSNTLKFTIWLHGVLEKLRTVAVETSSLKPQPVYADIGTMSFPGKARVVAEGNIDRREDWMLPVSSSSADRTDARVSTSSSLEYRISCGGSPNEKNIHRLMSTVKPLMESSPAEAVIDIKPELDDDLIDEDLSALSDVATLPGAKKKPLVTLTYGSSHPATETYRVPDSCQYFCNASENKLQTPTRTTECALYDIRPIEVVRTSRTIPGAFSKFPENYEQNSRPRVNTERINIDEDVSRKRKSSVISSVVKISKYGNEDQDTDEMEEEDEGYPGRAGGLLSSISVPSKPERRPTLPPSKQANKNLILKAISEAQESVSKTTSYPPVPQRQTVPVAPRTRSLSGEETLAAQHVHETIYHTNTRIQLDPEREHHLQRQSVHSRLLASRLQLDIQEEALLKLQGVSELADMKPDTRSFILKKPALEEAGSLASRLGTEYAEVKPTLSERLVQSRDVAEPLRPTSPKFIVTLDGVPSPPGYENYGDDMGDLILKEKMKADKESSLYSQLERKRKLRLERDEVQNLSGSEEDFDKEAGNMKHQKVTERCRYWPTCKSGDECLYHHPATMCKTFPNCRFGDKCLFIHPTCKYDAKCTNPDCKYTHVARRRATTQLQPAAPVVPSTICRFFPDCKKMDCSFYHPKPCRFTTHCKRPDCTFYHPKVSLPPRQALKWTKTQNS